MIATSGFLVALEWTKFVCSRGSAPDPDGGAYSAPTLPSRFRGIRRRERRKKERREEGSEKKTGGTGLPYANSRIHTRAVCKLLSINVQTSHQYVKNR